MRTLFIGMLIFITWSAFSTHFYVCEIKGLCAEPSSPQTSLESNKDAILSDTLNKPSEPVIPGNMIINFAFDKSEFNPDASTDNYYEKSEAYLNQNTEAMLSITGYTDAIGTEEYNQALGFRRAQVLQQYFEKKGLTANKIIIDSKGEKDPADDNATISGRANNRRTVVTIKH